MPLLTKIANAFKSATTTVDVSAATAPSSGQVLTATSSTAATWQTPSGGGATIKTLSPFPSGSYPGLTSNAFNTNTRAYVGMVTFPHSIVLNAISFTVVTVTTAGTVKLAIFTEDGQTQKFVETTASISATGRFTHTLAAAVTLSAGNYYIALVTQSTTDLTIRAYSSIPSGTQDNPTGKAVTSGYITVAAGVMPATFSPTADITQEDTRYLAVRLDN